MGAVAIISALVWLRQEDHKFVDNLSNTARIYQERDEGRKRKALKASRKKAGAMAQWGKALDTLAEDQSSTLSAHGGSQPSKLWFQGIHCPLLTYTGSKLMQVKHSCT